MGRPTDPAERRTRHRLSMTDTPHHNRRSVIATLGGATLGVAGLGLTAAQAAAATDRNTATRSPARSAAAACVLTPEQTEGPYYLDLETVRKDITEGRA